MAMVKKQVRGYGYPIQGVSLASFLQILGQERKSCSLIVAQGKREGYLFFNNGDLIDAEYAEKTGIDAAFSILSWEEPAFSLGEASARAVTIVEPLERVILTAAARKDENPDRSVPDRRETSPNKNLPPALEAFVVHLTKLPGLQAYYLLDKKGRVVAQSRQQATLSDFIAYTLVNAVQMQNVLQAGSLRTLKIALSDDSILLIIPAGAVSVALILPKETAVADVFSFLKSIGSTT
ncbi:MAG: hypothetical protein CSA20_05025 [Deltaproteobacteria bacterium]|nr:MAG: hypothetical protein CSB32_00625 [Desulfobacterales bacterium]PIE73043.1 MAG: hypothetical protein CSA20_05025 [Deltaproteobacteria bacterium]